MSLGFELAGKAGFPLRWNDAFDLVPSIRESKWNRFGSERFEVLFTIWVVHVLGHPTVALRWLGGRCESTVGRTDVGSVPCRRVSSAIGQINGISVNKGKPTRHLFI